MHVHALGRLLRGSASRSRVLSSAVPASAAPPVSAAAVKALREATGAGFLDCQRALQAERGDVARAVDFLRKKGLAAAAKKAARTAAQGLVAVALSAGGAEGAMVELNSETDFVARNAHFQALAARLARTALVGVGGARPPSPEAFAAALAPAELAAAAMGAAASGGATVAASVAELVGKVGENIVLRRGAALAAAPGGLVSAYVHNAAAPGLGSIGVLVALAPEAAGPAAPPGAEALRELGKRVAMHIAAVRPPFLSSADVPAAEIERERAVLLAQAQASKKEAKHVESMLKGRLQKFFAEVCLLEQPFALDEKVRVGGLVKAAGARVTGYRVFVVGESAVAAASTAPGAAS